MTHSAVHDALLDDERTDAVEAHLETCSACADFAARLTTLRTHAGAARDVLAPAPPEQLADRVLAGMRGGAAATPIAGASRRRRWVDDTVRRSLTRSAAVAAAVLLVTGLLAVLAQPEDDRRHEVLLASAERTEAAGTAEVTVEGHTELVVPVKDEERRGGAADPGDPEFEAFPPELRQYMEQQWARIMADFERQLAAFEAQVDETIRRGQEQIDRALREAFENFGQGAPRRPSGSQPPEQPEAPEAPERPGGRERGEPPARPNGLSLRLALTATGQVDFGGRANLEGSLRPAVPTADLEASATPFAVSVDGADASLRHADGSWARLEASAGPLGAVLVEPGAVGRILRGAEGDVEAVGDGEVDGERVQRYRFDVDAESLVRAELADQEWEAEVAIDGEGRVRTLRLRSQGGVDARSPLTWHTDVTMHLRNFGASVAARPPAAADARATLAPAARSSVLVYPFGQSVAASLQTASSKSR